MLSLVQKRGLLCAITFTLWFGLYVYNPFMTPYLSSLHLTATLVGIIVGAYGIAQLFLRFFIGIAADLLQKHRLFIILGTASVFLASTLRFFFATPAMLFIANVLSGVGASTWVSFTILFSLYYKKEEIGRSLGLLNTFNNGGVLMGNLLSGVVYQAFGMRSLFLFSMIVSGIGVLLGVFFLRDEPKKDVRVSVKNCLRAVAKPRPLLFSLLLVLFQIITFSTCNSFASTLFQVLNFSSTQLSFCTAMFMLSSTISSFLVSLPFVRRIKEPILLFSLFFILAIYCVLLSFCKTFLACVLVQLLGGLGCASLFTLLLGNVMAQIPTQYRSTAMGFAQSFYSIGIITGPIIMGKLVDMLTLLPAFRVITLPALLGSVLAPLCFCFFNGLKDRVS